MRGLVLHGAFAVQARTACMGCLALRRGFAASAPGSLSRPSYASPTSAVAAEADGTAATPDKSGGALETRRKRRQPPRSPQPGVPDPPWPADRGRDRRRTYVLPQGLAENALLTACVDHPAAFAAAQTQTPAPALVRVGVPRAPNLTRDYTSMGPDVVAPWRRGGSAFRALSDGAVSFGGLGDRRTYGVRCHVAPGRHVLHPYSARFLAASPGVPDEDGNDGSTAPLGFPHGLAEVVRRLYAHKNRTDPLWWYVMVMAAHYPGGSGGEGGKAPHPGTHVDMAMKPVVRNKMRAKVHHAFKTALARRGYSAAGVRLPGAAGAPARHAQLYGSVRLNGLLQPLLRADYDRLAAYLTEVVGVIEDQLGGGGGAAAAADVAAAAAAGAAEALDAGESAAWRNTSRQPTTSNLFKLSKPPKPPKPPKRPSERSGGRRTKSADPSVLLLDPALF